MDTFPVSIPSVAVSVNSTLNDPQPSFLIALARVLGRSRAGQFIGAVLIASVSGGMAYLIWQHREFAGLILTIYVLSYGARKALEFLPIPSGVRQAWARHQDLYNLAVVGCFLLVAYYLPGTSWTGWHYLAFGLLGVAFSSITLILARLDDLDRSKKSSNSRVQPAGR
ncbi:MAG: hypothetical protein P4L99_02605 [Chthoniobacter sp.]|nr:hypothetical protein [Chthoniobacter sp.]